MFIGRGEMAGGDLRMIDVHANTGGGLFLASDHLRRVFGAQEMQHVESVKLLNRCFASLVIQ
ncbi:hypothetical protein MHPYR_470040 [uncultured Mycobacterium sp.]|uniref:Uncharacterized protein n=1 Tax=uncultured Mycobacterium sp. TaxID=171292 RepID=A0A1Y5PG65_9MYCO|nr:hypothetical protein MHPYR_470040 [uncultured Mycobacterium sp.]